HGAAGLRQVSGSIRSWRRPEARRDDPGRIRAPRDHDPRLYGRPRRRPRLPGQPWPERHTRCSDRKHGQEDRRIFSRRRASRPRTACGADRPECRRRRIGMDADRGDPVWHALPAGAVLAQLAANDQGLPEAEAAARRQRYGLNEIPAARGRSALWRFLAQFNNVLIYFLLLGAAAALVLGHLVDAGVIIALVIVNAVIGFIQEGRAEQALDA